MSAKQAYPLYWPEGWKRSKSFGRTRAQFGKTYSRFDSASGRNLYDGKQQLSVAEAVGRLRDVLGRMGIRQDDFLISTNVPTRMDGLPRSDRSEPSDPGAAAYWRSKGRDQCMAIDRYDRVADNLAAIAATLDALRAVERHGGGEILERAFTGFAALPPGGRPWREVLGMNGETWTAEQVQSSFRELAHQRHPDKGGAKGEFQELVRARDEALKELQK